VEESRINDLETEEEGRVALRRERRGSRIMIESVASNG